MTQHSDPRTDPSAAGGPEGVGTSSEPGEDVQPDAITPPSEVAGDDDVAAEPADAHRPNPQVVPEATDQQVTGPDQQVTDPDPQVTDPDQQVTDADQVIEGDDDAGAVDELAGAVDYEQLAADDPRTPGQLLAALHAAEASSADYLEALQRKQAEFENFRKRMQAQGQAQRVAGHADVAGRMLEVLDDFDRTLDSIADHVDDGVLKGVGLVRDKLMGALAEVGLERVDDRGAPFDPNRHEAVQQVPGEGGEPVVAEVLRPGYVLGPRVLRAAMVAVAQ